MFLSASCSAEFLLLLVLACCCLLEDDFSSLSCLEEVCSEDEVLGSDLELGAGIEGMPLDELVLHPLRKVQIMNTKNILVIVFILIRVGQQLPKEKQK